MKRFVVLLVCIFSCFLISSCNCNSSGFDRNKTDKIYAQIVLSNNNKINLKLCYDDAPVTVNNFIDLALDGYYDNTIFHRVIKNFMVQTGGYEMVSGNISSKGKVATIKGEFKNNGWNKNSIKHDLGVISMARSDSYDSASSQFFICVSKCEWLDDDYAAFGKTTDSQSNQVAINISKVQTYSYSTSFTNMPVDVIKIKTVNLSNSKF